MLRPTTNKVNKSKWEEDFETKKYRIDIVEAELQIPVRTMQASLDLKLEQLLAKSPMVYRTVRMDMMKVDIPLGATGYTNTSLKSATLCPDRMFFAFVPEYQMSGKTGCNSYRFSAVISKENAAMDDEDNASLIDMKLYINSELLESYDTNTRADTLKRKYLELNNSLGNTRLSDSSVSFGIPDYANLKFVVGYDLTVSKNAALLGPDVRGVNKDGAMKLDLKFDKPIPAKVWLLVFSEYHSKVEIDKNRNVSYFYIN